MLYQSTLLNQILQVGNLFSHNAFQEGTPAVKPKEVVDSDEEEKSPEFKRIC